MILSISITISITMTMDAIDANYVLAFKTLLVLGIYLHATLLELNKPLAFSP